MTAEERIKLWKATDEYNKKLNCFAGKTRLKLTKEQIASYEGMTVEEMDELIAYDPNVRGAFEKSLVIMKNHFVEKSFDRAFGYYKDENQLVKDTIDSNGKAVRVRSTKKKWHEGNGDAFFYWAKKFLGPEFDNDEENREFKRENKVKCVKPKKKK